MNNRFNRCHPDYMGEKPVYRQGLSDMIFKGRAKAPKKDPNVANAQALEAERSNTLKKQEASRYASMRASGRGRALLFGSEAGGSSGGGGGVAGSSSTLGGK